jgi:hypothetical protein
MVQWMAHIYPEYSIGVISIYLSSGPVNLPSGDIMAFALFRSRARSIELSCYDIVII